MTSDEFLLITAAIPGILFCATTVPKYFVDAIAAPVTRMRNQVSGNQGAVRIDIGSTLRSS